MADKDCPLCKAIAIEPEAEGAFEAYPGSMTFEILETKDKKKHDARFMVVATEHVDHVSSYEEATAKAHLFRFMIMRDDLTNRSDVPLRKTDFYILERTHATIPNHWHLVACDAYFGNDFEKINDTDRIMVIHLKRGESLE